MNGRGAALAPAAVGGSTSADGTQEKRRRERVPKSCLPCLAAKRKCDRGRPECSRCAKHPSIECKYDERLGRKPTRSRKSSSAAKKPQPPKPDPEPVISGAAAEDGSHSSEEDEEDESSDEEASSVPAAPTWPPPPPLEPRGSLASLSPHVSNLLHQPPQPQPPAPAPAPHWPGLASSSAASGMSPRMAEPPPFKRMRAGDDEDDPMAAMQRKLSDSQAQIAHLNQLLAMQRPVSSSSSASTAQSAIIDNHTIAAQALSSMSQDFGGAMTSAPSPRALSAVRASASQRMGPAGPAVSGAAHGYTSSGHAAWSPSTASVASAQLDSGAAGTPSSGSVATGGSRMTSVSTVTNGNGQTMYFGDAAAGVDVLETVSSHRRAQQAKLSLGSGSRTPLRLEGGQASNTPGVDGIRRDLQDAYNAFLHTEHEAFPFHTIWSSDPAVFVEEVSPLFHSPSENVDDLHSFQQSFACRWPALGGDAFISRAKHFFHLPIEEKMRTPLPMVAEYLMVIALGRHCDLDNPQLGAFHASETPRADGQDGRKPARESPFHVTDTHLSATYQALRLCSFLSSPSLETIHAQLLIGVYLRNTERSSSFWPLLGSIARQAQSIGLHIDPSRSRTQYTPDERQVRRLLWWAIVCQDAQLSGVFGRPLAITHFSTRIGEEEGLARDHHEAQCQLAKLARKRLDESQITDWSLEQLEEWTTSALEWYNTLPDRLRLNFATDALRNDAAPLSVDEEKKMLSSICASRGLKAMQQACDLAMDFSAELIFAHRPRLSQALPGHQTPSGMTAKSVCAWAIRSIRISLYLMVEHLGPLRTSLLWRTIYICFQAAATAAFICLMHPLDASSKENFAGLCEITALTEKAPNRWGELVKVKRALNILMRLTSARMDGSRELDVPMASRSSSDTGPRPQLMASNGSDMQLDGQAQASAVAPTFDPLDIFGGEHPSFEPPSKAESAAPTGSQLNPPSATLPESEVVAWWSEFFSIPFNMTDLVPGSEAA